VLEYSGAAHEAPGTPVGSGRNEKADLSTVRIATDRAGVRRGCSARCWRTKSSFSRSSTTRVGDREAIVH
jgi:hypothetical protein